MANIEPRPKDDADRLVEHYNKITRDVDEFKAKAEAEWDEKTAEYLKNNCSVEVSKVYQLVSGGKPYKGYKRFVITGAEVSMIMGMPVIYAQGWWLSTDNDPIIHKEYPIHGIANPKVFQISPNQNNNKHKLTAGV